MTFLPAPSRLTAPRSWWTDPLEAERAYAVQQMRESEIDAATREARERTARDGALYRQFPGPPKPIADGESNGGSINGG